MTHPLDRRRRGRPASSAAILAASALLLTACGGSGGDVDSAVEDGGELTVWAWDSTVEDIAAAYEEENPQVTIEVANVGTGDDQYTALQNAISAGSGGPDLAQIEYFALPQFVIGESVAELSDYEAAALEEEFAAGPWNGVTQDGGVYGLPMDSGPMALFYNQAVFDEHGLEVPATWEEYAEVARALHQADPEAAITNDTGDAGLATSMIWQAGGRPFQVEGTEVSIDLSEEPTRRFAEYWQGLLDDDLLAPVSSWSDEWYQGLGDGSIATLITGAWMPTNLENSVPEASGDWRAAPLPQWSAGEQVTAENGGSGMSVMENSEQKDLAYDFLTYLAGEEGTELRVEDGGFPARTAMLESDAFQSREVEYFGGQTINEIFAESSANVGEDWQYLPYQVYAHSIFNDHVGEAYQGGSMSDGLAAWEQALESYGADQGFDVAD